MYFGNIFYSFLLFTFVFVCIFNTGLSLRCYECNSHINPNCSMKAPPKELEKQCSDKTSQDGIKYTMCRKIAQTVDFEVNGLPKDIRVIRSCAWDESQYKNACYQRSGFGGRQEVCSCSTDLCNSSSIIKTNYHIILIFASIIMFITTFPTINNSS